MFNELFEVNGYDVHFERQSDASDEGDQVPSSQAAEKLSTGDLSKASEDAPKKKDRKRNRPGEKEKAKKKKDAEKERQAKIRKRRSNVNQRNIPS